VLGDPCGALWAANDVRCMDPIPTVIAIALIDVDHRFRI
jgi:hypothetical protein